MPADDIEEGEVRRAIDRFSEGFGSEAIVELISVVGRVLEVKFSGHMCFTCDAYDYFDDYALVLEEASGAPYAVWDHDWIEPYFVVKLVKLDFLDEIAGAMKDAGGFVRRRMEEFEKIGEDEDKLFRELCFCILTANFRAEDGIRIQEAMSNGFLKLREEELAERLRKLGYRFPKTRARYIVEARRLHGKLGDILRRSMTVDEAREWFVENVKGLGYKEASHFLRNVGFRDVAIIDRHVLRFLEDKKLIEGTPKSLNKVKYMRLERLLLAMANRLNLSLGELDLYIWYKMTGKVLK